MRRESTESADLVDTDKTNDFMFAHLHTPKGRNKNEIQKAIGR